MDLTKLNSHLDAGPNAGLLPCGPAQGAHLGLRDNEMRNIASQWAEQSLTVLSGPAGAGKTSLLHAEILTRLQERQVEDPAVGRITSWPALISPAVFGRNLYTLALLTDWAPGETVSRLAGMTITEYVRRKLSVQPKLIVAVDQFESLFLGSSDMREYRDEFLDDLAEAVATYADLHVLIVIRDEALAEFRATKRFKPSAAFRMAGLSRDAAAQAASEMFVALRKVLATDAAMVLADELLSARTSEDGLKARIDSTVPPTYLQLACVCLSHAIPDHIEIIASSHVYRYLDIDQCISSYIYDALIGLLQRYDLRPARLATLLRSFFLSGGGYDYGADMFMPAELGRLVLSLLRTLEDCHVISSEVRSGRHHFRLASSRLRRPFWSAVESIEFLSRSAIDSADVVNYLADAIRARSQGDSEVAVRQATAVLTRAPVGTVVDRLDRARAELLLADIAFERGDRMLSRQRYARAAELFETTDDTTAVGNLLAAVGRLQSMDGDIASAVSTLRSAVDRLPVDATVMVELARALANSGQPNAAAAILESVRTVSAGVAGGDLRALRGEVLSDVGDARGALRDLGALEGISHPSAQAARALSLARLGHFPDAEREIGLALDIGDDNGPVLLRAAQIRALRGDSEAAAVLVRDALKAKEPELTEYQRRQADELREPFGV
jgi:tetratricopeptide (TPR) repeat protein